MNHYTEGPSLAERSGYWQLGTNFWGDPDAVREPNRNPHVNRELIENSIVRHREAAEKP